MNQCLQLHVTYYFKLTIFAETRERVSVEMRAHQDLMVYLLYSF